MTGSTAPAPRRAPLLEQALDEAARHLARLGYRELDRPGGGCDLVVASAHRLVFCRLHAQRGLDTRAERREPPSRHGCAAPPAAGSATGATCPGRKSASTCSS
jgi:hypothetical protein